MITRIRAVRLAADRPWKPAVVAVWRAEPLLALLTAFVVLLSGAMPALFIVTSGTLAGLLPRIDVAGVTVRVAWLAGLLVVLLVVSQVMVTAQEGLSEALGRRMDMVLRRRLIEAIARPVGIGHLEDPATQGQITIAHGLVNRVSGPAGGLIGLIGRLHILLTGIGCAVLLALVNPWLAVTLAVLNSAAGVWLRREYGRLLVHTHLDPNMLRRAHYLRDVLLQPGAEKEVRVFSAGSWFASLHHAEWLRVSLAAWRGRRRSTLTIVAGSVLLGAGQAGAVLALTADWRSGHLTLPSLVIGLQAVLGMMQFAGLGDWDRLASIGWQAVTALISVEDRATADGQAAGLDPGNAPGKSIEFRDVHFAYPDGTQVLRGVSFTIEASRSCAIVGRNGAGKSTLLKLLFRSYEPTRGQILVDGVALSDLDPARWRARLSTMVQDFVHLPLTVRENVLGPDQPWDGGLLDEVARRTGLDEVVGGLPAGWDTILSRQLRGGTELSGGQWQKVALARALYALGSHAGVLALDEPTASMDIEAEQAVYEAIIDATSDRTLILVSHRFGTVRRADHIVVLDEGTIAEAGTHDQLIQADGLYARMFQAQAAITR